MTNLLENCWPTKPVVCSNVQAVAGTSTTLTGKQLHQPLVKQLKFSNLNDLQRDIRKKSRLGVYIIFVKASVIDWGTLKMS